MSVIKIGFLILLINICIPAWSAETIDVNKQAEALLEVTGVEQMLTQSVAQTVEMQLRQNPAMTPYKDTLLAFFNKHISYTSLKPDLIKIYSESFTGQELQDLNDFYRTPTGQKSVRIMPELMVKGSQLGATKIQENILELKEMIQEASKNLEASQ